MGLVELVMAVTILGFVLIALGAAMGTGLRLVGTNRQRVVAANLAAEELETVRSTPYADLPLGTVEADPADSTVDGVVYRVVRETDWLSQESGEGACAAPGGDRDVLSVRVSVSWPNMGVVEPVQSETIISATGSSGTATDGSIAVALRGGNGQPVGGVTVGLSGGPTAKAPLVTTSAGCAYFSGLKPGSYTASLSHSGFVDDQGNPTVTIPNIGVEAGSTRPVTRSFDRAAMLALTFEAPAGHATPAALPVTIANTRLTPSGTKVVLGGAGGRAVAEVFPDVSGYSVWAGSCADADPLGVVPGSVPARRYYPAANRPEPAPTTAGRTTSAMVALHPVQISARRGTTLLGGAEISAVHADPAACAGSPPLELSLGATDSTGVLRASLPLGSWRFEVVGSGSTVSPAGPTIVAPGSPTLAVGVVVR